MEVYNIFVCVYGGFIKFEQYSNDILDYQVTHIL